MGTTGQSITLANSIIGVGILAMPFCFQQCGVLLATLILLLMGLISRLCCYFLLKSALIARRRNFEFLAFHVFGPAGKLAVEVGIIGFLMGTCIAYFVVVGDLGPQIISKMFNINQSDILRTSIMVIVSLVCVLPLGLLRNVDSLSNVSAATIGFYFCLVMKVILEAASQLLTGEWQTRMELWKPSGVLQCVPIFSMALFCQTQLFEIFESLPSISLEKMNVVTKNAINICTSVYFTLGVFGYIAFCKQDISGNILMSLSPTMASDVIKLGFVMSLAFSFPLIIFPCRASLYSFLYRKVHPSHHDHIINHSIPEGTFRCITVCIVAVSLFVSLLLPNIELVLGLLGSTIGVMICIVFPAAAFINLTFKDTNERLLAKVILILGLFVMVLGTYANLQAAENKVDRYDERSLNQERIDKIVEDFFQSKKLDMSEDAKIKPVIVEPVAENGANIDNKFIKDSEVQPPNPIPPESVSNEKNVFAGIKDDHKLKEVKKESIEVPEAVHPKNLNIINENKVMKEENKVINNIVEKQKEEKNVVAEQEETAKQEKALQQKIDQLKQRQLIETIKQHGEEQKELMKEQKEILHKIMKTKEELQQKKEVDEKEAKKIAVESIQKIANVAIKSLSGVSEKPGVIDNKKAEPLQKTANEAVQEIAKQAVESIKEIEGKLEKEIEPDSKSPQVSKVNDMKNNKVLVQNIPAPNQLPNVLNSYNNNTQKSGNTDNSNNLKPLTLENVQAKKDSELSPDAAPPIVIPSNINKGIDAAQNAPIIKTNEDVNTLNLQENNGVKLKISNIKDETNIDKNDKKKEVKENPENISLNQATLNNGQQKKQENNIDQQINFNTHPLDIKSVNTNLNNINKETNILQNGIKENIAQQIYKQVKGDVEKPKEHIHQSDEAQSYRQGEDTRKVIENNLISKGLNQNVPLAVAMNSISKIPHSDINNRMEIQKPQDSNVEIVNKDISPNNNVQVSNMNPVRQKRDIKDSSEKISLKEEDKETCNNLIDNPKLSAQDILSKVDFNDVALPKILPLDSNLIHHIRSLKSYDSVDKKR